jgi:DNA-binding NarL/FixJ family response regulator
MGRPILVAVAGAHEIVAGGLRCMLASADDIEILERCSWFGTIPDVVVYDVLGIDADGGAELCTLIKRSDSSVIVVGRDLRPDLAARALAQGAAGCFSLESDRDSVLSLIRAAARGELDVAQARRASGVLGADVGLSQREVDVLDGIARGLSNDEIGHLLGLTGNTIKSYIRSAYYKIGVTTRSQAVAWCLRHGFEPPGPTGRSSPGAFR